MAAAAGVLVSIVAIVVPISFMTRHRRRTAAAADRPVSTASGAPPGVRMTPDGSRWWDGAAWVPSDASAPPGALWSPDGRQWYDGLDWHDVRPGHP